EVPAGFECMKRGSEKPAQVAWLDQIVDRIVEAGDQIEPMVAAKGPDIILDPDDIELSDRCRILGVAQHFGRAVYTCRVQPARREHEGGRAGPAGEIEHSPRSELALREPGKRGSGYPLTECSLADGI